MKLATAIPALLLSFANPLAASGASQQPASRNPLARLALDDFLATLSHPLFAPSRTPSAVEVPVEEPEVMVEASPPLVEERQPPPLKLVGVVAAGADEVAILTDESTGQVHRLASGEKFEDWTVDVVNTRTVEFQNADERYSLALFEAFEPPPAYGGYQPNLDPHSFPEQRYPAEEPMIDPDTGYPIDPSTGYPTDPQSGLAYDPNTGYPVDPSTGQLFDPDTGDPIDPNTGEPIEGESTRQPAGR